MATIVHVPNASGPLPTPRTSRPSTERHRLGQRFDRVFDTGVLLVSAGAGYGKTTALSSWVRSLDEVVVAWITCGDEHNDPRCLAQHLASKLATVAPRGRITAVADVADAVGASEAVVVVVLDDAHHLDSPSVWASVEELIRRRPHNLRIVVSGRDEEGLPWHRLRPRGEVTEVGNDDLCFTEDEARALLTSTYGIDDVDGLVPDLLAATQGWAVGLCIAGHALRVGATEVVAHPMLGRHRYIRGYFDEELLRGLDTDHVTFLEATCLLDRLDPELCDLLTGRSDSHQLLEHFVDHNLFTNQVSTQPPVFRYHQLFVEYLRTRAGGVDDATATEQLAVASRWYEAHGLPAPAIDAAVRAGDLGRVERLIRAAAGPALSEGFPHTVERWLSALPARSFDENPDLTLLLARSAGATGNLLAATSGLAVVDAHIRDASELPSPSLRLARQNLSFVIGLWTGDLDAAAADLDAAEALLAEQESGLDSDMFGLAPSAVRSYRALLRLLQGELSEAVRLVERVLTPGQLLHPDKDTVLAEGVRALALAWQGESHAACEAVEQYRISASAFRGNTGGRLAMLAAGAWCCDLDVAERDLGQATAIANQAPIPIYCAVHHLAATRFGIRSGRLKAAAESLEAAHEIISTMPSPGVLAAIDDGLSAELAVAIGELADVSLNERELVVLELVAAGASRRETAEKLYLSVNTVKTYLRSAYRKLSATNRDEAVERARALGMFDRPGSLHRSSPQGR